MCVGRLRADTVSRSTDALRQTATTTTITTHRLSTSHRTTVLCTTRRQNTDRNTDQGYVTQWRLVQLALRHDAVANFPRRFTHTSILCRV